MDALRGIGGSPATPVEDNTPQSRPQRRDSSISLEDQISKAREHHRQHVTSRKVARPVVLNDSAKSPLQLMQPLELEVLDTTRQESPVCGCPLLPAAESPTEDTSESTLEDTLDTQLPIDKYVAGEDSHEKRVMAWSIAPNPIRSCHEHHVCEPTTSTGQSPAPVSTLSSWDIVTRNSLEDDDHHGVVSSLPDSSSGSEKRESSRVYTDDAGTGLKDVHSHATIRPSTEVASYEQSLPLDSTVSSLSGFGRSPSQRHISLDRELRETGFEGLSEHLKIRRLGTSVSQTSRVYKRTRLVRDKKRK